MVVRRRDFVASGVFILAGILPLKAKEPWPTRPVRFIVPLAAGGAIDFVARQCGIVLSRELGQQVFVENHAGGGSTIGMDVVMRNAPDGYTFLVANNNAAIAPHILNLPYDYTNVLLPVIQITREPLVFAVHPSLGVKTIGEFIEYAKRNPGIDFATSGVGSNQHVIGAWFAQKAGLKLEHVPYRGAGQAVGDLIAGHVKFAILGPAALLPQARAGSIILIAQTDVKRSPALPDVPTLVESGFKGLVLGSWAAIFAPPGTPTDIITSLNAATNAALRDQELQRNIANASMETVGGSPQALGALARADSAKYASLIRQLGIVASSH